MEYMKMRRRMDGCHGAALRSAKRCIPHQAAATRSTGLKEVIESAVALECLYMPCFTTGMKRSNPLLKRWTA
eukprot:3635184-Amphidinium_carterae.1